MSKPNVALIGLGIMGSGMAGRLLTSGFPLTIYNRNREKTVSFEKAGAFVAASPREAASRAQIILSMVADDSASRSVWLGEDGALAGAAQDSVLIESSTLSVAWVKELHAAATRHGCRFLDAPVTGTKPHAASGELLFLVGGSGDTLNAAKPIFAVLGRDIMHLGPVGSGALMKLINNFLCGVEAASFAEGLALIDAGGLDRNKAVSILTGGAPGSGIMKRMSERVAAEDFTPNFNLRWMAKDLSYALHTGSESGVQMQTAGAALAVFERAIEQGLGDEDFSAVAKAAEGNHQQRPRTGT